MEKITQEQKKIRGSLDGKFITDFTDPKDYIDWVFSEDRDPDKQTKNNKKK